MARKLRLEYPGAIYHVINRGNYRADIFATQGARDAFCKTLDEACVRSGWVVHAWCLMSNHYHLALQTPRANLVSGMQWLQTTFSARFNVFRNERGHVFQGRYKAFNIEPGRAQGAVCHYIHLNPIQAKMMSMAGLTKWPGCSLGWIMEPKKRAAWFSAEAALSQPAELKDTAAGRTAYEHYLAGLATDDQAQRELCFEEMAKGWAVGSMDFKKSLLQDITETSELKAGEDSLEAREIIWQKKLNTLKSSLGLKELRERKKSADWKVAIAAEMKRTTTATNGWLASALEMGNPCAVSRLATECRQGRRAQMHLRKIMSKRKA